MLGQVAVDRATARLQLSSSKRGAPHLVAPVTSPSTNTITPLRCGQRAKKVFTHPIGPSYTISTQATLQRRNRWRKSRLESDFARRIRQAIASSISQRAASCKSPAAHHPPWPSSPSLPGAAHLQGLLPMQSSRPPVLQPMRQLNPPSPRKERARSCHGGQRGGQQTQTRKRQ